MHAPLLLTVFGRVPVVGTIVSLVVAVWALLTMVRALRTGLGLSAGKAVGTWLVASLLPGIVLFLTFCAAAAAVAPLTAAQ